MVIPSYKPNEQLIKFVHELLKYGFNKIVVVDDGSGIEYNQIFEYLKQLGVNVVEHKKNLGKGVALKSGIKYSLIQYGENIQIITADSDGQHIAEDLIKIDNCLNTGIDKLIVGTRSFKENIPVKSRLGNKISEFIFFIVTNINCPDTQSGLRGIPINLINLALKTKGSRFEYETNFLIKATKQYGIKLIPISTIYKNNNNETNYSVFLDSFLIFKNFIKNLSFSTYLIIYLVIIIYFTAFILLETFVFPSKIMKVKINKVSGTHKNAKITENSYTSDNISIHLKSKKLKTTTLHIADITISNPDILKTGLAYGTFGLNVNQITSEIAKNYDAILAINGDNYGFRSNGYVMRNKIFYRKIRSDWDNEMLIIDKNGDFITKHDSLLKSEELIKSGVIQIFSFGPTLIKNGSFSYKNYKMYGRFNKPQPRTAICQIGKLHYIFAVTDGRLKNARGITLDELAQELLNLGCTEAYNLDGGGSSTMFFNGRIVNIPTTYGFVIKERAVSDIIYIEK